MAFRTGDSVEVSIKEQGFMGSFYEATIIAKIHSKNEYVVEYKTLLEEDCSLPLREVVAGDDIRPAPANIPATQFRYGDKVDAFDNDGWWVGTVSGISPVEDGKYFVYFEDFFVELVYDVSVLRVHQDWKNGEWCFVKDCRSRVALC